MAKRKSSSVKAGKQGARVAPTFPAGFKPIEHMGSFWSGKTPGEHFEGRLLSSAVKHFPKSKGYEARDANVYTFETKDKNKIEITQSGGLGALTKVKKGQWVYIIFMGMKKLKGKMAMREYAVAVK